MYEVGAALSIGENTEPGTLVTATESETLGSVEWPPGQTPDEHVIATFEAMRERWTWR